jgi:branched-chain amino acid transport system substrate-binding protein
MSTDASGQAAERAYETLLSLPENKVFQLVSSDHFSPAALSVDAQIQHVRSANADVLVSTVTGSPFGTILRALNDAGLRIPFASSGGNMTYAQMEQSKAYLPKTLLFPGLRSISRQGTERGPIREAQRRYFAIFDAAGTRPDSVSGLVWDLTSAALDAVKHIGVRATAEQIRDYMENLRGFAGVNGVYDYSSSAEHRGLGANAVVVVQWDPSRDDFIAVSRPGGQFSGK